MPSNFRDNLDFDPRNYIVEPTFESFLVSGSTVTLPTTASRGWYTSSASGFTASVRNDNGFRSTQALRILFSSGTPSGHVVGTMRTVAAVDRSKQLTISFPYRTNSTYVSGDMTVVIRDITNSTTITPAVTAIPASTSDTTFQTSFISTTGSSYEIRLVPDPTVANGGQIELDNVSVGSVEVVQGVPVTEWATYTPTIQGFGASSGNYYWRRVGDTIELRGRLTAGVGTAVEARIGLPTGLTIGTLQNSPSSIGVYFVSQTTDNKQGGSILATAGNAYINFSHYGLWGSSTINPLSAANDTVVCDNGDFFTYTASAPIAGWAGSTVGLANSRVEFAYNDDVTATASVTATGFGYGPAGQSAGGFGAGWTVGTTFTRRVRFTSPIQATDQLNLQYSRDSGATWHNDSGAISGSITSYMNEGSTAYGGYLVPVSGSLTDVDVTFGNGGRLSSVSYSSNGTAWSGLSGSAFRWRLVKCANPLSIGRESENILGTTTNDNAAAGFVGEVFEHSVSTDTNTGATTVLQEVGGAGVVTWAATPGDWDVSFVIKFYNNTSTTMSRTDVVLGTASGNNSTGSVNGKTSLSWVGTAVAVGTSVQTVTSPVVRVSLSTSQNYYLKHAATFTNGQPQFTSYFIARRVR